MKIKRALYLTHRWLGVVLCLFMAMWFLSGVVMMYVGYPKLTNHERLSALPLLTGSNCCVSLPEALAAAKGIGASVSGSANVNTPPRAARLTSVAGAPRYVFTFEGNQRVAVDAQSGKRIERVSAPDAVASARAFMRNTQAEYVGVVTEDAWTHSAALKPYRPLHHIQMHDAAGTTLYVASNTGEVVRDASRLERNWNWLGAWIHWLYPFRGGALDAAWHDIVVYTSIVGTVLAIVGMVLGVWRWRFSGQYKTGSRSPYREGWMRWHHIVGLVFGVLTVTFIFSGLMSMNPFKVLDSGAPKLDQRAGASTRWQASAFSVDTHDAIKRFAATDFTPVELEWRVVDGKGYVLALDALARSRLLAANSTKPAAEPFARFEMGMLQSMVTRWFPNNKVTEATVLTEYDTYYYSREAHTMSGGSSKPLPVLRVKFDDANATWLHLDPYTGATLNQLDSHRRVGRWLFAFLHSFDWLPLLNNRPAWDFWMILISVGGFVTSFTGIVIGWRRLRQKVAST